MRMDSDPRKSFMGSFVPTRREGRSELFVYSIFQTFFIIASQFPQSHLVCFFYNNFSHSILQYREISLYSPLVKIYRNFSLCSLTRKKEKDKLKKACPIVKRLTPFLVPKENWTQKYSRSSVDLKIPYSVIKCRFGAVGVGDIWVDQIMAIQGEFNGKSRDKWRKCR